MNTCVVISCSEFLLETIVKRIRKDVIILGWYDNVKNRCGNINAMNCLNDEQIQYLKSNTTYIVQDNIYKENLMKLGIAPDVIINYSLFKDETWKIPSEGFTNNYTKILAGMSHAQTAFSTTFLDALGFFKLASPSMDMFLHYEYISKLITDNPGQTMEEIVIELPYYIFNYDLSLFGEFVYTKLSYFREINNYHNFGRNEVQKDIIRQFDDCYKVFNTEGGKNEQITLKPLFKRILIQIGVRSLLTSYRAFISSIKNNDKVWSRTYESTIKENSWLWGKLLNTLQENYPNCRVKVLVMPMNPAFRMSHKKTIKKQRDLFYKNIGDNIFVIDDFSYFMNPFLYSDHCHLNKMGCTKYSKRFMSLMKTHYNLK